jgi:hypothetical protein
LHDWRGGLSDEKAEGACGSRIRVSEGGSVREPADLPDNSFRLVFCFVTCSWRHCQLRPGERIASGSVANLVDEVNGSVGCIRNGMVM